MVVPKDFNASHRATIAIEKLHICSQFKDECNICLPSGPVVNSILCIIKPLSPEMMLRNEASFSWYNPIGLGRAVNQSDHKMYI